MKLVKSLIQFEWARITVHSIIIFRQYICMFIFHLPMITSSCFIIPIISGCISWDLLLLVKFWTNINLKTSEWKRTSQRSSSQAKNHQVGHYWMSLQNLFLFIDTNFQEWGTCMRLVPTEGTLFCPSSNAALPTRWVPYFIDPPFLYSSSPFCFPQKPTLRQEYTHK